MPPRDRQAQVFTTALLEAMRAQAIPSDWLEPSLLSARSSSGREGMHVHFIVKKGGEQLLAHAGAIETAFRRQLTRLDTAAAGMVFSISWILQPGSCVQQLAPGWKLLA